MILRPQALAIIVTLGIAACGDGAPVLSDGGADGGVDASPCPGGKSSSLATVEIKRVSKANRTEVQVVFLSLRCLGVPAELSFGVSMTNHSCSIPGYDGDLDKKAVLVTSGGASVTTGFRYLVGSKDSHHPKGVLSLPATAAGKPLVDCDTQSLTLELKGVDQGIGEKRSFVWSGKALDPIRSCSGAAP